MPKAWAWIAGVCGVAFVSVVALSDAPPPVSVWSDGEWFSTTPDGAPVEDYVAHYRAWLHCGEEERVKSASGAIVPCFGDPVILAERPSWLRRAWASVPVVGTPPRPNTYVYELAKGRPDFCGERGEMWFRYDLSKAVQE